MKRLKNFWNKYGIIIKVEIIVLLAIYLCTTTTYEMTYEIEYQRATSIVNSVSSLPDFDELPEKTPGYCFDEFMMTTFYYEVYNQHYTNYHEDECSPYAFNWKAYNNFYRKVLDEGSSDDFEIIFTNWGCTNERIPDNESYLLSDYFSEEEMAKFWDFYSTMKSTDTTYLDIDKVVGYYDNDGHFIPTEVTFRYVPNRYSSDNEHLNDEIFSLKNIS